MLPSEDSWPGALHAAVPEAPRAESRRTLVIEQCGFGLATVQSAGLPSPFPVQRWGAEELPTVIANMEPQRHNRVKLGSLSHT